MALPVHFLLEAQPLCAAPRQLLGTRDTGDVTCPDCLERIARLEGLLPAQDVSTRMPKVADRRKRTGLARS